MICSLKMKECVKSEGSVIEMMVMDDEIRISMINLNPYKNFFKLRIFRNIAKEYRMIIHPRRNI